MRKNVLIIFALIMLSACHNRQTQAESAGAAVADSTEVMAPEETDSMASHPQNYRLTGTIGEDKASMELDKNGNDVTGVVTRCDYCVPINVEGTWQGDNITVDGVSQAGSHIEYKLTVTGNGTFSPAALLFPQVFTRQCAPFRQATIGAGGISNVQQQKRDSNQICET
jgi:hypothetical protein